MDEHKVPDLQHVGVVLVDKMGSIPTTNPVIVDLTAGPTRACVTHLPEVILHVAGEDFGVIQPARTGDNKPSCSHWQGFNTDLHPPQKEILVSFYKDGPLFGPY